MSQPMPQSSFLWISITYNIPNKEKDAFSAMMSFEKAESLIKKIEKEILEGMREKNVIVIDHPDSSNESKIIIDCSTIATFSLKRSLN